MFDLNRLPALAIETLISALLATSGLWVWNKITHGSVIRLLGGTVEWSSEIAKPGSPFNPDCEYRWTVSKNIPMDTYENQVPYRFYATTVSPTVLATSNGLRQFWILKEDRGSMHYWNKGQPQAKGSADGTVAAEIETRCQ